MWDDEQLQELGVEKKIIRKIFLKRVKNLTKSGFEKLPSDSKSVIFHSIWINIFGVMIIAMIKRIIPGTLFDSENFQ